MEKSNIAFGLITAILGIYISVALLLSRARQTRMHKTARHRAAEHKEKRNRPWTSFSS
jgi:hypothetical protein